MDERTRDAIRRALRARAPSGETPAMDDAVARIGSTLDRAGGRARTIDDPDYPRRLLSLPHPPDVLCLAGPWDHEGPVVAVVGSRSATGDGIDVARDLAHGLAERGVAVVSGLAAGIDAAAHAGALAAGGRSGAVLGTPLDRCYPREHRALQAALRSSLGLWSELLPGSRPRPSTFASRNRLLAAGADAIVIVQGDAGSGALLTVEAAERIGRPVGAVPWDPRDALAAAPHALIHDRRATLVRDVEDVVALFDPSGAWRAEESLRGRARATAETVAGSAPARARPAASASRSAPTPAPTRAPAPAHARVLAALRNRAASLDDVAARAGMPASETAAALITLELDGRARREPGGLFRLARRG